MGLGTINGHDPEPGSWHPADPGASITMDGTGLYAGPDPADTLGAGMPTRAHVQPARSGPAGAGSAGPAVVPLSAIDPSPPAEPVLGFIAAEPGAVTIVYGDGGSGKGTLAASWLAQLSSGGHRCLIIDAEGHPREWRRRVAGLGGQLDLVAYWAHPAGPLGPLDDYRGLFDLVVIDSAAYFRDPDQDDWAQPALAMQEQARLAGVPFVVLAHVSKAQPTRAYGSGYWHNVARASYQLVRDEDGTTTLTCRKATDLAGVSVGDRWTLALSLAADGVTPAGYVISQGAVDPVQEQLLRFLAGSWRSRDEVMEHLGIGKTTAQRLLNQTLGLETSQPELRGPKYWRVAV